MWVSSELTASGDSLLKITFLIGNGQPCQGDSVIKYNPSCFASHRTASRKHDEHIKHEKHLGSTAQPSGTLPPCRFLRKLSLITYDQLPRVLSTPSGKYALSSVPCILLRRNQAEPIARTASHMSLSSSSALVEAKRCDAIGKTRQLTVLSTPEIIVIMSGRPFATGFRGSES